MVNLIISEVPDSPSLNLKSDYTIELWIKTITSQQQFNLINKIEYAVSGHDPTLQGWAFNLNRTTQAGYRNLKILLWTSNAWSGYQTRCA